VARRPVPPSRAARNDADETDAEIGMTVRIKLRAGGYDGRVNDGERRTNRERRGIIFSDNVTARSFLTNFITAEKSVLAVNRNTSAPIGF